MPVSPPGVERQVFVMVTGQRELLVLVLPWKWVPMESQKRHFLGPTRGRMRSSGKIHQGKNK